MLLALLACESPPDAAVEFSDAARYGLEHFDDEADDALAPALLALEEEIYAELTMDSETSADRALALELLTETDVAGVEHPDRDPAAARPPVALARESRHPFSSHVTVAQRADLSPMEPNSPNLYARTITDGGDCWGDRECDFLRTQNQVRKENILIGEVEYRLDKDYRWVDLGDDRWAVAARSWQPDSATSVDGGTTLWQSFTFEIFLPIEGSQTLRMMAVWAETELSIDADEELVETTQLVGIDDIFKAHDTWLDENGG